MHILGIKRSLLSQSEEHYFRNDTWSLDHNAAFWLSPVDILSGCQWDFALKGYIFKDFDSWMGTSLVQRIYFREWVEGFCEQ